MVRLIDEKVRALLKCTYCNDNNLPCDKSRDKICSSCDTAGRTSDNCSRNKDFDHLADLKDVVPSLVAKDSAKHITKLLQGVWMGNLFVANLLIALAALWKDRDEPIGGANYQYAVQKKEEAWDGAYQAFTNPTPENKMGLYVFAWIFPTLQIAMSRHTATNNQAFAIAVSRALQTGATLYHRVTPFVKDLVNNDEHRQIIQYSRIPMTEPDIVRDARVQQMYKVIDAHGSKYLGERYMVIRGDARRLATRVIRVCNEIKAHRKDTDPRHIMFWTSKADLNEAFWPGLNVRSKDGSQHDLWWLLLANWALPCYPMGKHIWYLKDVGRKILEVAADILEQGGLDKDEYWRQAMERPLLAIEKKW